MSDKTCILVKTSHTIYITYSLDILEREELTEVIDWTLCPRHMSFSEFFHNREPENWQMKIYL